MKKISILFILLLLLNCSKDNDDKITGPSAAALIFPDNNQECNQGTSINATLSSVTFTWTASTNADTYDIIIKNLETGASNTETSITTEKAITINKGTAYSWYVISKNTDTGETTQSQTWKFYNAGDSIEFYTPFPAELVSPAMGSSLTGITSQTLSWQGSDIDNDIANYDVYFGTVNPPTDLEGNTAAMTMDVTVSAGNTYYWRVVTIDNEGNTSQSEVFQFKIN